MMSRKSFLIRLFGFRAALIHGEPMVLDRWYWLKARLPRTANNEKLIDIGCGTGAFSIAAAKRGYQALGISWDERNQAEAGHRAQVCGATAAVFEICDIRFLQKNREYYERFDVAVCTETIEHILNDVQLMHDISKCLKPGGRLLLTTPNYYFRAVSNENESGPYPSTEDGDHVRRGYTRGMLAELCKCAGLVCEEYSYCSGFLSQKATALMRFGERFHSLIGWLLVLPFRPMILLCDPLVTKVLGWPHYSICMVAYKPRFAHSQIVPLQTAAVLSDGDGMCSEIRELVNQKCASD